jgi:hypothetical protein
MSAHGKRHERAHLALVTEEFRRHGVLDRHTRRWEPSKARVSRSVRSDDLPVRSVPLLRIQIVRQAEIRNPNVVADFRK